MDLKNKKTVYIIGGGKTGYNLHVYFKKLNINSKLYFFTGEFSEKKNIGESFLEAKIGSLTNLGRNIILTSETALNNLDVEDRGKFNIHYFLRDKLNISLISKQIKVEEIPILDSRNIKKFIPVIAKPKSSGSVPFKFKIINDTTDLDNISSNINNCIFQQYFGPAEYKQIAIAGYFINDESSLISVEQLNQYPIGVSSHVRLIDNTYDDLKKQISQYLSRNSFTGFIEFEFKVNRKSGQIYLIDVNPRLWGWSYFYFSGVQNIEEVVFERKTPILKLRMEWINPARYVLSFYKGRFTFPKSLSISFEPLL